MLDPSPLRFLESSAAFFIISSSSGFGSLMKPPLSVILDDPDVLGLVMNGMGLKSIESKVIEPECGRLNVWEKV